MNQLFYQELVNLTAKERIKTEEPMKNHTTFRVGCPASFFVMPERPEEIREIIALCRREKIPYYVMGNGSNILVSDKGYQGVIIQIYKEMSRVEVHQEALRVQAGALLSAIAGKALEAGLTGFEFAAGIPGTLGGACVMNAGAYGGEMKDVVKEVTVLTQEGKVLVLSDGELRFGYRTSVIAKAYCSGGSHST